LVARLDGPVVQGAPGPPAPQDIPAGGAIAGQIGQHNDLFATIAAAAGAPLQPWDVPGNPDCLGTSQDLTPQGPAGDSRPMPVDGRDLLPILRNPAAADVHDFMFFHYEGEAVRSRPGFYSDNAAVDTDPLLAGPDYPPSLFAGRTAAGETCQPCAEGVPDPDSSCDKAAWKLIKAMRPSDDPEETESKGWRLYNLAKDPKERTDCLADTNLPAEELVKVQNVGQDMCRRAAYWQKFTPRGQWQQQPPEQRCVENVTRGTLQAWWSSTHANDATAPCL
jgi:hypothetical protein